MKLRIQGRNIFATGMVIEIKYHIYSAIRQGFPLSRMTTNN